MNYKSELKPGQRFGRLVLISYGHLHKGRRSWLCQCDCGAQTYSRSTYLCSGAKRSCGCFHKDLMRSKLSKHGHASKKCRSTEYKCFAGVLSRCNNVKDKSYKDYGGRGIECRFKDFEEFIACVGKKPSPSYSIDRIDNNGHYEKGNVRWSTRIDQASNRRSNKIIEYNGKAQSLSEWARELNVNYGSLATRFRMGWTAHRAFSEPYMRPDERKRLKL